MHDSSHEFEEYVETYGEGGSQVNLLWRMMREQVSRVAAVGPRMTILEKVKKVTRRATMSLRMLQIRVSVEIYWYMTDIA